MTSAIYSPRLERNIGFAWLPVKRSTLGERLTVETEWGPRSGTVVEMPFVDPSKQIPSPEAQGSELKRRSAEPSRPWSLPGLRLGED